MKRQVISLLCAAAMTFGLVGLAEATLMDMQSASLDHVIYDDQNDLYWYWDVSAFTGQTYNEQLASIDNLNMLGNEYFGLNDWHMATRSDIESLVGTSMTPEMTVSYTYNTQSIVDAFNYSEIYYNPDGSIDSTWTIARVDEPGTSPGYHTSFGIMLAPFPDLNYWLWGYDFSDDFTNSGELQPMGAWAVSSASFAREPVPEPTTMLLFCTGIAGLAGTQFRRKKK